MFITVALGRVLSGILDFISDQGITISVLTWDTLLNILNNVTFNRSKGKVVAAGLPGHNGIWPTYLPPRESDSRSPCPALNAMANHGILPRDGRNITFRQMNEAIQTTFNFAPTFCFFVPRYAARMLGRSYWTGTMNLSDLSVHNGIEHDASLTRHDVYRQPDQSKPALDLIDALLASATGPGGRLTAGDLTRYSAIRRAHSHATNPQFTLSTFHKVFGSSNTSTIMLFLGENPDHLATLLKEERLADGFETCARYRFGLTMARFNASVLHIELGIDEGSVPQEIKALKKTL